MSPVYRKKREKILAYPYLSWDTSISSIHTLSRLVGLALQKSEHILLFGALMPYINTDLINAIANIDPLNLAILIAGLSSLGAIWLASIVVKNNNRSTKK